MIKIFNVRHKFFFYISKETYETLRHHDGRKFPWEYYYKVINEDAGTLIDNDSTKIEEIKENPNWKEFK